MQSENKVNAITREFTILGVQEHKILTLSAEAMKLETRIIMFD